MLVALVVSEKEVLAMHAPVVFPPPFGLFNGFALRVVVHGKGDIVFVQEVEYNLLACHSIRLCFSRRVD